MDKMKCRESGLASPKGKAVYALTGAKDTLRLGFQKIKAAVINDHTLLPGSSLQKT